MSVLKYTITIPSFQTNMSEQIVQNQIRLGLEEQSDQSALFAVLSAVSFSNQFFFFRNSGGNSIAVPKFAVIYLKFKQRGQILGYIIKKMQLKLQCRP